MLRDGGNVVLAARTADKLDAIATELDSSGARVAQLATDIGDADQCRALAQLALDRFGTVDGVVQVAAYDGFMGGLDGTADDDWTAVLGTNVVGTMHVVSAMAEAMGDRGGSIVFIGSQSSVLPPVMQQLAYTSSKGALHSAMFHLAKELGPRRIRVNTRGAHLDVGPAGADVRAVADGRPRHLRGGGRSPRSPGTCRWARSRPTRTLPNRSVFLCSDRARMITGQTLYVNAGEYMT